MTNNNIDLKGQVAVITGAGRGFGLAFARGLAEHGALPIITDINEELGQASAQVMTDEGLPAHFMKLDVTDPNAVEAVAQAVWKEYGRLDLWINNAGLALHGPSETLPIEHWQMGINI
ncbi:MAG: SDR family NAD(P)-dependent oxidoreductase, partial [Burkholderiales bacterium]|nr:SDR family NAD(P)-dependent oxidoreductase [Anaerolineae bacterium]